MACTSLGASSQTDALGQPAPVVWPEAWDRLGPLVQQVMTTGESVRFDEYWLPVYRNDQVGDAYWTVSWGLANIRTNCSIGNFYAVKQPI